jgi:predicted ATP-dependent serine protease
MTDAGFVESSPASLFLTRRPDEDDASAEASAAAAAASAPSGCAVAVAAEGTRCLCVEVQALVTRSLAPFPRTRSMGVSLDRLHLLAAVLGR